MLFEFDKESVLNKFQSRYNKNFDYNVYFSSMNETEEKKEEAKKLAEKLEVIFILMFALYAQDIKNDEIFVVAYQMYIKQINEYLKTQKSSSYIEERARNIIFNILETTRENVDGSKKNRTKKDSNNKKEDDNDEDNVKKKKRREESYYLSIARAKKIAANEASAVINYKEYTKAVKRGMNKKTWVSENDKKVRKTHKKVNKKTIDIFEPFEVGNSKLMFPKDISLGADVNETENCRCIAKYSKSNDK